MTTRICKQNLKHSKLKLKSQVKPRKNKIEPEKFLRLSLNHVFFTSCLVVSVLFLSMIDTNNMRYIYRPEIARILHFF